MKLKNKIFLVVLAIVLLAAAVMLISGNNLFPIVFVGLVVLFLLYALWDAPSKHKDLWCKDQQRAISKDNQAASTDETQQLGQVVSILEREVMQQSGDCSLFRRNNC